MRISPLSYFAQRFSEYGDAKSRARKLEELQQENAMLKAALAQREEEAAVLVRENEKLRRYMEPLEAEVQRVRAMSAADWGELCDEEKNILMAAVQHSDHSHEELASLYHVTEARISLVLDDLRGKGLVSREGNPSQKRVWRATHKGLRYLTDRGLLT